MWVNHRSNVGRVGHLGHFEAAVGHLGPMGHVDHWAREFMLNKYWGYWIFPYGFDGPLTYQKGL